MAMGILGLTRLWSVMDTISLMAVLVLVAKDIDCVSLWSGTMYFSNPWGALLSVTDFGSGTDCGSGWITSAALSPNKKRLALLDSQRIWLFENWQGDDFFSGDKYRIDLGIVTQKEAITFVDEETIIFTDEEFHGIGRNIYEINLNNVTKNKL